MKQNHIELSLFRCVSLFILLFILAKTGFAEETLASSPHLPNRSTCNESLKKLAGKKDRSNLLNCIRTEKRLYYKLAGPPEVRLEIISDLIVLYHQSGLLSGAPSDLAKERYWRQVRLDLLAQKDDAQSVSNTIVNLRNSFHGNQLRVVLDLKSRVRYETHENKDSMSIEFNFLNTLISPDLEKKSFFLSRREIRAELSTKDQNSQLSLVNIPYESFKILQLPNPSRWVLDIRLADRTARMTSPPENDAEAPPPKKTLEDYRPKNQGIHKIIIDPGHGGKDPGAIGLSGYSEKEAVLDIGLRLKELLVTQLKVEVIMTRSNDVFIPLEERTKIANEANADLFISIHANSSPHRATHGVEIYLLGQSSDKRALRTAARENNITEEEASNMDKNLLSIKKDLFQEYKKQESLELAHITRSSFMNRLRPSFPVIDLGVKTAPFYVLIHTSMPSILAEVSFISNPVEEQRLKSKSYRQIMAESLLEGIKKFISVNSNSSFF